MGLFLSRVCPCLGREEEKEKPKLSADTYIQKQYEHNNLIHDELGRFYIMNKQYKQNNLIQDELFIPVSYYVMNKRHYHNI
jgi:hypothetical protein